MVYYQLRMKSHEKIKDFLKFWKKCLKKGDDENHFPEDYRNISSAYRYAKHGKWNLIEKKLEDNCIENKKIMLKTLGSCERGDFRWV